MTMTITLRLVHIVLGIFWVGTVFFIAAYLIPSVKDAGAHGASVMQALQRRHLLEVVPAAAALTILSGLTLYWQDAARGPGWATTPMGLSLGVGALFAVAGFLVGVFVMRAATIKAGAMARSLPGLPEGPQKDIAMAEIQRLRRTGAVSARWVAVLLAIAASLMAVARYV
jgi:hypothetical protein